MCHPLSTAERCPRENIGTEQQTKCITSGAHINRLVPRLTPQACTHHRPLPSSTDCALCLSTRGKKKYRESRKIKELCVALSAKPAPSWWVRKRCAAVCSSGVRRGLVIAPPVGTGIRGPGMADHPTTTDVGSARLSMPRQRGLGAAVQGKG